MTRHQQGVTRGAICPPGLVRCVVRSLICIAVVFCAHAALAEDAVSYMVALSPDGTRVAVGKRHEASWDLFEGPVQGKLSPTPMPSGMSSTGVFAYSVDGKSLLFATNAARASDKANVRGGPPAAVTGSVSESLWRQQLDNPTAKPQPVFEHPGISNVLPLADGSIVFMGAVGHTSSTQPLLPQRVWTNYAWMMRKPGQAPVQFSPREYAFFGTASLIRDEAVILVQQRLINRRPLNPREYEVEVTPLKPAADPGLFARLTKLANVTERRTEPELQCDWSGQTCGRVLTYTKDQYFAHQLQIIRGDKICEVKGLPDRLEKYAVSRNGGSIVLVARPSPYREDGYTLVYLAVSAAGCAGQKTLIEIP